jgi:hypothetical protein
MDIHTYEITISVPRKELALPFRLTLRWLKRTDPRTFGKVTRRLKIITVVNRPGSYNETDVRKRQWILESGLLRTPADVPQYLASLLLHEAEHIAQFQSGKPYRGARAEVQAYRIQRRFLARFGEPYMVKWLDAQFRSRWWVHMDRVRRIRPVDRK